MHFQSSAKLFLPGNLISFYNSQAALPKVKLFLKYLPSQDIFKRLLI